MNKHITYNCNSDIDIETLLVEYASGTLNEAQSLLVETYRTFCKDTCNQIKKFEDVGGILIDHMCGSVNMSKSSLEIVLERIETPPPPCKDKHACQEFGFLPQPVIEKLQERRRPPKWSRIYKGIRHCSVPTSAQNYHVMLVKLAPGSKTPHHHHKGVELTLVLQGAFHDEYGSYKAGELIICDETHHHTPVADAQTGCVCMMVTNGPVYFTRGMARLFNLFQ